MAFALKRTLRSISQPVGAALPSSAAAESCVLQGPSHAAIDPANQGSMADPTNVHPPWASWSNRSCDLFVESVQADVWYGSRTRDSQIIGLVLSPELTVLMTSGQNPCTEQSEPNPFG